MKDTNAKIESGIANIPVRNLVLLSKIFKSDMNLFFKNIE